MPPTIPEAQLSYGAKKSQSILRYMPLANDLLTKFDIIKFEEEVISGFIDKLNAGINIPAYPQFRDMNQMFLDLMEGLTPTPNGYAPAKTISIPHGKMIPEVYAIKSNLKIINDATGVNPIKMNICITGPYTLSNSFTYRSPELIENLGDILAGLVASSIFHNKNGETSLLSIDEPVFGFLDDPFLDVGHDGRESLQKAWENITKIAAQSDVITMIHLHNTSDSLMWDIKDLNIISSHVNDPLYSPATKRKLEETDKRLKASIAVTLFDDLIAKTTSDPADLGIIWTKIKQGTINPEIFLEDVATISGRLRNIITMFGEENVPYAGPECGLKGHPTYDCAVKYLSRISSAVSKYL